MPLGMEVGLGPGDFVLDGDPPPHPQKGAGAAQFSDHVHCGETAGWIRMALGMEMGFGVFHIVLDGDPAPLHKKGHSPQFSAHVYCGQTAGWIKMPLGGTVRLCMGGLTVLGAGTLSISFFRIVSKL